MEELCRDFDAPAHEEASNCPDLDPDQPAALFGCQRGSGYAGQWAVDVDGLPRYDLTIEHRCDPAGYVESAASGERIGPAHLLGNGRGVVAVASASGAVELYSQERGGKWLNKVDVWKDPDDEDYPMQIGGGFSYLVVDGEVRSTRFDDLDVGDATELQSRRFGVGYVETVTKWDDLLVTRRVFAPDIDARALVAEVTIQNLTNEYKEVGLVELWDVNVQQVTPASDDAAGAEGWAALQRERRAAAAGFEQTARWSQEDRTAVIETTAGSLPGGVSGRGDVSETDWFVDPIFLAPIDAAQEEPDGVWLGDDDLWDGPRTRRPPGALDGDGDAGTREEALDGVEQRAVLAVRVPVQVPTEAPVVRRFAFGYVPEGRSLDEDLEALRDGHGELGTNTAAAWKEKLVYVAAPEVDGAAALQREVAWSSYEVQAGAAASEYFGTRAVGPGGAARYLQGVEGAAADLALMADALVWVDPALARETLLHALATQRARTEDAGYQLPSAWGGVGFLAGDGERRTDSYFLLPAAIARYVAGSRDATFLETDVPYWPLESGQAGTVIDHLAGVLEYVTGTLGEGDGGFIAAGDSDFGGAGPFAQGSSVFNAGAAAAGFPLVADVVEATDATLANDYRDVADAQRALIESDAWDGDHYRLDGGDDVALYPQVFPLLAGVATAGQRDDVLALVEQELETSTGARLVAGAGAAIHPVANAWLTAAYALRDAADGWSSLWRNGMAAHAEAFPDTWVGVWTAPAAWSGDDPAAADPRLPGAGHLPALSAQVPAATLRALFGLLGVAPAADALVIDPRVPGESVSVVAPRFELTLRPDAIAGALVPSSGGTVTLHVTLPTGLRAGEPTARVDDATVASTRDGDVLSFDVPLKKNTRVVWSID